MNKHQQKAIDRANIIRQMERDGERLTIANIAAKLGIKKHSVHQVYRSFALHGLEVPDYERIRPARSGKWRGQAGEMRRADVSTSYPAGLTVMDETIRPWGDNEWIGMVR